MKHAARGQASQGIAMTGVLTANTNAQQPQSPSGSAISVAPPKKFTAPRLLDEGLRLPKGLQP